MVAKQQVESALDYASIGAALIRSSPVPLYYQLAQQLEASIADGTLQAGSLVGNEVEVARRLGVSRPTVRRAIGHLVDKGLLIRRRGVGTLVAPASVKRPITLSSLYDDLVEAGQEPTTTLLRCDQVECPGEVADTLRLASGSQALFIERLRRVDGKPIALMENYLPLGLIDGMESRLETTGLYRLFRASGVDLRVATQRIGAAAAGRRQAELLEIPEGESLLTMERVAYDGSGRSVEYGSHAYPACRYSFEMTLVSR